MIAPWRRRIFLGAAACIRWMPRIRGKVRAGLALYRWANAEGDDFVVETTLYRERLRFVLHLTSAHERMAFLANGYENDTTELLARLWTGGSIVDVGANIGLIAVPLAVRLSGSRIWALEAIESNFETLQRNIESNDLSSRVKAYNVGAGAETRDVFIQIEGDDPSRTGTANVLPLSYEFNPIPLRVRAIDDLVRERALPSDIGLMKIDTDGYDFEVLKGCRGVLTNARPVIHAELNAHCLAWHGQTVDDVDDFLRQFEYELWTPAQYSAEHYVRFLRGATAFDNCLLLPAERAKECLARATTRVSG